MLAWPTLFGCAFGTPGAVADPPSTPSPAWVTDGSVRAVTPSGSGTVYIGGTFNYMGPPTGAAASLPVGGGEPSGWQIDGSVKAVAPDGSGGWYVGGSFTSVGGVARSNLAHITADGGVDPLWDPQATGGTVSALALSGQTVFAGGSFTSVKGQPRKFLVALDQTGSPTSFSPLPNGAVNALALSGQTLYAGGSFTKLGETVRNRLAAFDTQGVGLPTNWDPNASSAVNALAISGSTVYLGGSFSQIGGQARNRLAAVSASSGALQGWNPNVVGPRVDAIEVGGGNVYVGGDFTQVGGQQRLALAAVSQSTGQVTGWNPTVTDIIDSPFLKEQVHSLELSGGTLYVGGDFYWVAGPQTLDDKLTQGQARLNVAAIDASSGQLQPWDLNAADRVHALHASGGQLFAGGSFRSIGGAERRYIAEVNLATGRPTSWRSDTIVAGSGLQAIEKLGPTLYIAGNLSSVGGQPRDGLAAVSAQTGAVQGWNPTAAGELKGDAETLAATGSTVYVGGDFWEIAAQARAGLVATDAATGALSGWNPNPRDASGFEGAVNALALSGPTLYVGGRFVQIGGQARSNLAALDAASGSPTGWNPNPNDWVNAIEIDWPTIYIGGWFDAVGGQPRQHIAAVDAGGAVRAFNPGTDGPVDALAYSGSTLYAGGPFTLAGGQPRNELAAFDPLFGTTTSWSPPDRGSVSSLATVADSVYAGGSSIGPFLNNGFAMFSSAPFNETPPVISGTPSVGQTLTVSNGTWSGEVHSYRYQWLRNGEPISGATGSSYQLTTADAGKAIGAAVTASTLSESATARAEPVSVGNAPVNTSPPRISGAPTVGRTLTASRGSWSGTQPLSYAYQWQRCEGGEVSCTTIPGETSHRYVLSDEDMGESVRVEVTATNANGSASASSAPTGAVAPSRSLADTPAGEIPGTDPLTALTEADVPAVEQPNTERKPFFAGFFAPNADRFAPQGDPSSYVSTAVGDGLLFVGSQRNERIYAFDAATLAESYRRDAPGVRGIAYAEGELFAIEKTGAGTEVGVYDAATGAPKRRLVPPLAGNVAGSDIGRFTGISVSFGEAWLTFAGGPGGGGVMILDAQTGALRSVTWHFGRYDCSLNPQQFTIDPERCLRDASADTGVTEPGWWDVATAPDLGGAFAGCRFTNRATLFSALALDDVHVGDATLSSDCAAGRYTDPSGAPREASGAVDGMSAVPGMGWVLTTAPDASGDLGSYVREYDAGSSLASIGAAELNLARSWRPRDAQSNNHRDIAYLNRDTRIDWAGELTDDVWQRGNRCLTYNVSDADIFVVGWRGERWFEPAREFQRLDVELDGQLQQTLNSPVGQWCFDLDTIPSGVHELELTAAVDAGRQVSIGNAELRVDHNNPIGTVASLPQYVKGMVTVPGTMNDAHSGPREWRLQARRADTGAWFDICTDAEADQLNGQMQCEWNTATSEVPDGEYVLRSEVRDELDAGRGGPNLAHSPEASVTVGQHSPGADGPSAGGGERKRRHL